jgi:hypothetical protein
MIGETVGAAGVSFSDEFTQESKNQAHKDIGKVLPNAVDAVATRGLPARAKPKSSLITENVGGLKPTQKNLSEAPDGGAASYKTPFKPFSKNQRANIKEKVEDRTATKQEVQQLDWDRRFSNRRATGVRKFWSEERARLRAGEQGTRKWSQEQSEAISSGKRPKFNGQTVEGHHKNNALDHPQIANDAKNIYPATKDEHLQRWHGGNFQNETSGKPLNPDYPEEF